MTDAMMKRLEALEAVAEAAEILAHSAGVIRGRTPEDADIYTHELEHIRHLMAMLSTLDALPASPPGEVAVWVCGNTVQWTARKHMPPTDGHPSIWQLLGTVRMALVKEAGDAG